MNKYIQHYITSYDHAFHKFAADAAPLFPDGKLRYQPTELKIPDGPLDSNGRRESMNYAEMGNQLLQNLPMGADNFVNSQKVNADRAKNDYEKYLDMSADPNVFKSDALTADKIKSIRDNRDFASDMNFENRNKNVKTYWVDNKPGDAAYGMYMDGQKPLPEKFQKSTMFKALSLIPKFNQSFENNVEVSANPSELFGNSKVNDNMVPYHGIKSRQDARTMFKNPANMLTHELGHKATFNLQNAQAEAVKDPMKVIKRTGQDIVDKVTDQIPFTEGNAALKDRTYVTDIHAEKSQGALSFLNRMRDVTGDPLNSPERVESLFKEIESNPAILDQIPQEGARYMRSYLYLKSIGKEEEAAGLKQYLMGVSPFMANNQQASTDKRAQYYVDYYRQALRKLAEKQELNEAEESQEEAREAAREAHRETARKAFAQGYNSAKVKPKQNKVANDLKPMGTVAGAIPNKNPDSPEVAKHKDKVYEMQKGVVRARLANDAATAATNKKEMPALKLPVNPPA